MNQETLRTLILSSLNFKSCRYSSMLDHTTAPTTPNSVSSLSQLHGKQLRVSCNLLIFTAQSYKSDYKQTSCLFDVNNFSLGEMKPLKDTKMKKLGQHVCIHSSSLAIMQNSCKNGVLSSCMHT